MYMICAHVDAHDMCTRRCTWYAHTSMHMICAHVDAHDMCTRRCTWYVHTSMYMICAHVDAHDMCTRRCTWYVHTSMHMICAHVDAHDMCTRRCTWYVHTSMHMICAHVDAHDMCTRRCTWYVHTSMHMICAHVDAHDMCTRRCTWYVHTSMHMICAHVDVHDMCMTCMCMTSVSIMNIIYSSTILEYTISSLAGSTGIECRFGWETPHSSTHCVLTLKYVCMHACVLLCVCTDPLMVATGTEWDLPKVWQYSQNVLHLWNRLIGQTKRHQELQGKQPTPLGRLRVVPEKLFVENTRYTFCLTNWFIPTHQSQVQSHITVKKRISSQWLSKCISQPNLASQNRVWVRSE